MTSMEPESQVEALEYAATRNIAAVELMAKGKLREALNSLNRAVAAAPSYHLTYVNRAEVFERMQMHPQAEADRRRAADLSTTEGDEGESEVAEAEPKVIEPDPELSEPEPETFEPADTPPAQGFPGVPRPPRSLPNLKFPSSLVRPVGFFVLLLAVTGGSLIGVLALLGGDDSQPVPGRSSDVQTPDGVAPPSEAPSSVATPLAVATGSPFSSSSLVISWRGRGITASLGSPSQGFSGFGTSAFDMSLSGDGGAQLSVFFYGSREAPQQDWDLVVGSRPVPKAGRVLPAHVSIWWNANVIIVVRASSGELSAAALDAFLSLGG
jgi:hypothetical protein